MKHAICEMVWLAIPDCMLAYFVELSIIAWECYNRSQCGVFYKYVESTSTIKWKKEFYILPLTVCSGTGFVKSSYMYVFFNCVFHEIL